MPQISPSGPLAPPSRALCLARLLSRGGEWCLVWPPGLRAVASSLGCGMGTPRSHGAALLRPIPTRPCRAALALDDWGDPALESLSHCRAHGPAVNLVGLQPASGSADPSCGLSGGKALPACVQCGRPPPAPGFWLSDQGAARFCRLLASPATSPFLGCGCVALGNRGGASDRLSQSFCTPSLVPSLGWQGLREPLWVGLVPEESCSRHLVCFPAARRALGERHGEGCSSSLGGPITLYPQRKQACGRGLHAGDQ